MGLPQSRTSKISFETCRGFCGRALHGILENGELNRLKATSAAQHMLTIQLWRFRPTDVDNDPRDYSGTVTVWLLQNRGQASIVIIFARHSSLTFRRSQELVYRRVRVWYHSCVGKMTSLQYTITKTGTSISLQVFKNER